MTKRAIVTGASGFVGSVLARKLLDDGHDVHLFVRPDSDTWRLDDADAPRYEVEHTDAERLTASVRSVRPDWVFHLAAHGAYPSQTDRHRMV